MIKTLPVLTVMCLASCMSPTSKGEQGAESVQAITGISRIDEKDPCGLNPVNYDSIYYEAYLKRYSSCLNDKRISIRRPSDLADEDDIDTLPQPFVPDPYREKLSNTQNYQLISKASTLEELALTFDNNLSLPIINQKIKDDILRLRKVNSQALEKYICLILLRINKNQLLCCNQRYDLGANYKESDSIFYPIQYEFYRFSNSPCREVLMPDCASDWIEMNKELYSDDLLLREMKEIKKLKNATN